MAEQTPSPGNPENYYLDNHVLLVDVAAAIDRLIGTQRSVMVTDDTTGRPTIEVGEESAASMRQHYRRSGTEPPDEPAAAELARTVNEALKRAATKEMDLARQWLASVFDLQPDTLADSYGLACPPTESGDLTPSAQTVPALRTWQQMEHMLPDGRPVTLSRTSLHGADAYAFAAMYRATIHATDGTDTFITLVNGRTVSDMIPVHSLVRTADQAYYSVVPATSRPDAGQLAQLRDQLAGLS